MPSFDEFKGPRPQATVHRPLPWWLSFWPPHVQAAHASHVGDLVGPDGQAPAYGGGPGQAYGADAQVAQRPITSMRELALGYGFLFIAPGATTPYTERPQVLFRAERLVIPSLFAPALAVVDIKVGNRSQLVNSGQLPAEMFTEVAVGLRLSCDTAQVAQDVTVVLKDTFGAGGSFTFAVIGTAAT